MCYFMTVISEVPIEESLISEFLTSYEILISEISDIVNHKIETKNYYQITHGCSCKFYSDRETNNETEIKKIIEAFLNKNDTLIFDIVLDNFQGQYDIGSDIVTIMKKHPQKNITIEEFLAKYPLGLSYNIIFIINARHNSSVPSELCRGGTLTQCLHNGKLFRKFKHYKYHSFRCAQGTKSL